MNWGEDSDNPATQQARESHRAGAGQSLSATPPHLARGNRDVPELIRERRDLVQERLSGPSLAIVLPAGARGAPHLPAEFVIEMAQCGRGHI